MFQAGYYFLLHHINFIKTTLFLKSGLVLLLFFFLGLNVKAQNLFANADFEQLNNCTEYHQDCASEAWFYIKPSATPLFSPNIVSKPLSGKDLLIYRSKIFTNPKRKGSLFTPCFVARYKKGKIINFLFI